MKRIFAILLAAATFLAACEKPDDGGKKSGGSHERSIISIAFAGQTGGEAEIISDDPNVGTVNIELAGNVDLSKVEITSLTISYKATSSAKKGDFLDFSSSAPQIVVTSEAGDTRTYTIVAKTFTESLVGCYKITGSMFYGGIGVDYGGCELMAPEAKSWCWDANGYGPAANYDDYFEIALTKINDDGTTEGTCTLYGGENGKHWNCVFQGAQNKKDPGVDIDLRDWYRLIPMGESTWKRDYDKGTITFTKDGKSVVSSLYEAGDYTVAKKSDGSKDYVVTVTDQALVSQPDGDKTWTDFETFTDYTKFVRSPILYAYMISKVDEIPAASKTAGDEGEINIDPVGPGGQGGEGGEGGDPSSVTLTGSWKVSSLKVFGGQGSTGWVEVKDKSWEWNSSCSAEYDNILTLGGETSGSYSYAAGADNKFWDCVLVSAMNKLGTGDLDLSYNYAQLPRSSGTFSTTALPISGVSGAYMFSSGSFSGFLLKGGLDVKDVIDAAKALLPTLPDVASLKIPAGGIGIGFQLKEYQQSYTWDETWMYSDFDRFVLHPFAYAMIFEKVQ